MPLKSMTGFGAARSEVSGWSLRVEIKAVNHKNLDVRINAPRGWGAFEAAILGKLRERIRRGRLSVSIDATRLPSQGGALLNIDEQRMADVITQLRAMQQRHDLGGAITLETLEPYRALFAVQETRADDELSWQDIEGVLMSALDAFEQARTSEGETLYALFVGHIARLEAARKELVTLRPTLLEGYGERLRARLLELSERHGLELDEERVIVEVNHFADRTDIAEELQRAGAHLERLAARNEVHGEPRTLVFRIVFAVLARIRLKNQIRDVKICLLSNFQLPASLGGRKMPNN